MVTDRILILSGTLHDVPLFLFSVAINKTYRLTNNLEYLFGST